MGALSGTEKDCKTFGQKEKKRGKRGSPQGMHRKAQILWC